MVVVVTIQILHTVDKQYAQKGIIVWVVSQVAIVMFNAMEINITVQAVHMVQRVDCKQMPVPGNVLQDGIANQEVHHRKKLSVDMDCQSLSIAPLDRARRKRTWVMVIPIAQLHRLRVSIVPI